MNNKLKIALISTPFHGTPPPKYGGSELVVWNLACGLIKLGHKVVLFAPKGSQIPPNGFLYETGEALTNVQVDWLKAEEDMWKIYKDKLRDFDIIHSHDWFSFIYASKVENNNLRCCHTHHGHLNPWWLQTEPPFKLNFISLSKYMQNEYRQQGIESQYVYNGIDLDKYPYQENKGNRLLFVGRLDSFKRPHIAIEVAKKLNLGLDIVGGSFVNDKSYLDQILKEGPIFYTDPKEEIWNTPDKTSPLLNSNPQQIRIFLDASQETKVWLYQNAKCVIFPSKMGEPFGLIVPESNSCGTPVIGSRDGAIPETIENGVNGFICDTVDEMCYAVERINEIKPENCRKQVEQHFSRDIMAKSYEKLYKEILEGHGW